MAAGKDSGNRVQTRVTRAATGSSSGKRTPRGEKTDGRDGRDGRDVTERSNEVAPAPRRLVPDGGAAVVRWHRNVIGVLLPTISVGVLFVGIILLAIVDPLFSESVNDTLVAILAYLFLILTALAIGISPYSFHRDKRLVASATGWRPSDLYYLLFVPGLNVLLAGIYLYQRNSAIASPAEGGARRESEAVDASHTSQTTQATRAAQTTQPTKATGPGDTRMGSKAAGEPGEERPDLPAELDYQAYLRYAIPYGFAAWLLGVLMTVVAVGLSDDPVFNPGNPFTDSIFWYITFHGFVKVYSETEEMWFVSEDALILLLGSMAAFPLLLFGALAVRRSGLVPANISQGALAGACITAGYAIPMFVMSAIVDLDLSPAIDPEIGFLLGYSNAVIQIDPISGLLAGLLFGVLFGGLGGLTARMRGGGYLLVILLTILGLFDLLIIFAFASGPS